MWNYFSNPIVTIDSKTYFERKYKAILEQYENSSGKY